MVNMHQSQNAGTFFSFFLFFSRLDQLFYIYATETNATLADHLTYCDVSDSASQLKVTLCLHFLHNGCF